MMVIVATLLAALAGVLTSLVGMGWLERFNPLPSEYSRLVPSVCFGLVASWVYGVPAFGLVLVVSHAIGNMYPVTMYARQLQSGEPRPDSSAVGFEWIVDSLDIRFGRPSAWYYRLKGVLLLSLIGLFASVVSVAPLMAMSPNIDLLLPILCGVLVGPASLIALGVGSLTKREIVPTVTPVLPAAILWTATVYTAF